jgi:hypothetical protein
MSKLIDIEKPNLIIHPKFAKQFQQFRLLEEYYNIIKLSDLTVDKDFYPILVQDNNIQQLCDVKLAPYFKDHLTCESGSKSHMTSYYFDGPIDMYHISENGPRYVIWTEEDPLTICATYVDRISKFDITEAYNRATNWVNKISKFKSIIVFDLDETLIDRDGNPYENAVDVLAQARRDYDHLVLYSHGSNLHVHDHVQLFQGIKFDLILSNEEVEQRCNKNLLMLYNYFPNTRFTKAVLVDDSLYNWTPEYTKFIVPNVKRDVRLICNVLT